MANFYDLIDTYADIHHMDKSEVLHLWYRGVVTAIDLLEADLENEGIYDYGDHLVNVIKTLGFQSQRDGFGNPWTMEV